MIIILTTMKKMMQTVLKKVDMVSNIQEQKMKMNIMDMIKNMAKAKKEIIVKEKIMILMMMVLIAINILLDQIEKIYVK